MIVLQRPLNRQPMIEAPPRLRVWRDPQLLLHLMLLTSIVTLTYYGMWRAYFATLDDFGITGWVRHQPTFWAALQGYGSGVRFFNYIPLRLKTELFASEAGPYLWSSLLQYLGLTWLVYAVALSLLQGRRRALLAALLFATTYSHYEVVTYVSASDYTLWATVYLAVLLLFASALRRAKPRLYWAGVILYAILAFAHDFTLSLPLVLLAYHLTIGCEGRTLTAIDWRELRRHLPFWGIWAIHVGLQLYFVLAGTSEAVYSENLYAPGVHMLPNLRYLIFLVIPNITVGPIQSFLSVYLSSSVMAHLWTLSMLLGVLGHGILLWLFWRGKRMIQFAVALVYLPFLQYTPWHGHFIEAPRYLLLPSVGYSLLLAMGIIALAKRSSRRQSYRTAFLLTAVLFLYVTANIGIIQVWVKQHIENGQFRRTFVTTLATDYPDITRHDQIWIEVPKAKFLDLEAACRLVYPYYVPCKAFISGEAPPPRPTATATGTLYWLRATDSGIEEIQRLPDTLQ